MKKLTPKFAGAFGVLALLATVCFAENPKPVPSPAVPVPAAGAAQSSQDAAAATAGTPLPARESSAPSVSEKAAATPKASGHNGQPRVFRRIGTGAAFTPDPGMATRKYKHCKYNEKGAITNAPCTGTKKDDKGVTWWP